MIKFQKFTLDNGLTVIIHEDKSTPLVCVNTLYKVGAKNEDPELTGMAHLFEHLMFGGSKHAPNFDRILEEAGGENNAFTNNDVTNYYDILPATNLETALWLEADRMQNLNLDEKSIAIQKSVVTEEFKENYLNQPYGDMDAIMRDMAFKKHPYRWSTIGLAIDHIKNTTHEKLLEFYRSYYAPGNAVLVIAGNIDSYKSFELVKKYFADIPVGIIPEETRITEPEQLSQRKTIREENVPQDAILMGFHMPGRLHHNYHAADLISDILANGKSSRFYAGLVREKQKFSELDAYIWGSTDPGLFIIHGYPADGISLDDAEKFIWEEIDALKENGCQNKELTKVKNKAVSAWMFSNIALNNKAFHLAYFENLGDVGLINKEDNLISTVTQEQIRKTAKEMLNSNSASILKYHAK
ncbi:MAG: M16 family metallopeptidase [Bacteroidales bacterium]